MWQRVWALIRRRRLDRELDEEIRVHLAMQEEEFRRAGMPPAEARSAAQREFGGVSQIREIYRERRGIAWLENACKDFSYGLRGLRRSPAFTAAAVLSLALGIGVNSAVFSLYHALLLRLLPVANPNELVALYRKGAWGEGFSSYPLYLEVARQTRLFQGVIGRTSVTKVRFGPFETAQREFVTGNYFEVLGVAPAMGRLFAESDNRTPHAHPVAVLSYDFWRTRLGGNPTVLGRTMTIDEQPLTVIGVAAPGFRGVDVERQTDIWVPVMMAPGPPLEPGRHWIWIIARRRSEASIAQIRAAMDVLLRQHLTSVYGSHANAAFRRTAMAQEFEIRDGATGLSSLREQFSRPLTLLMTAAGLVLLAACANVAHLLLARSAARQKEIALRISLGASRGRLVCQSLIESLQISAAGGTLGVILAFWGTRVIIGFLPVSAGEPLRQIPELMVLLFTLGVSLCAALLFGLMPAWSGSIPRPPKTSGIRGSLAAAQIAFSTVLIILAGLFGRSLFHLRSIDPGFQQGVIAFSLDVPRSWKPTERRSAERRLSEQLEALPGVTAVSHGFPGPFLGGSSRATLQLSGIPVDNRAPIWVSIQTAAARYFETLGAVMVAGREFDRADTADSRRVAIVNEAFVREYLRGEARVLDRILEIENREPIHIVGVARDIRHGGLRKDIEPTVYLPAAQRPTDYASSILVRTGVPLAAISHAIRRDLAKIGPGVTFTEPRTIRQRIDESIFRERMLAALGWFFGVLTLALAAIGLYGVVAFQAARRQREIGIRMALGADRAGVLWIFFRSALALIAAGLAIGMPAAAIAARQASGILAGIQPADLATYFAAALVLVISGLAAALLPARRAVSLDPSRVLRQD